jgi:hypothetical protein
MTTISCDFTLNKVHIYYLYSLLFPFINFCGLDKGEHIVFDLKRRVG